MGHVKSGSRILEHELNNLKFTNQEIKYITNLVFLHMRTIGPGHPKAIRRLLRDLNEVKISYRDLVRLTLADSKANLKNSPFKINEIKDILESIETEMDRKPPNKFEDLTLNGHDIMEITGLKPGPKIGEILNFLMDSVLEEPELNTKEQLTKIMEEKLKND